MKLVALVLLGLVTFVGSASADKCVDVDVSGKDQKFKNRIAINAPQLIYAALLVKQDPCLICIPKITALQNNTVSHVCFPEALTIDPAPVITLATLEAEEDRQEALRDAAKTSEKTLRDAAQAKLDASPLSTLSLANVPAFCAGRTNAVAAGDTKDALIADCVQRLEWLVALRVVGEIDVD